MKKMQLTPNPTCFSCHRAGGLWREREDGVIFAVCDKCRGIPAQSLDAWLSNAFSKKITCDGIPARAGRR